MSEIVTVQCEAQDHMLSLHLDSDEYLVYLSIWIGAYYAKQDSFLRRWWKRLTIVLTVLRGREYEFEDIVLSPESAQELATFLNGVNWKRIDS